MIVAWFDGRSAPPGFPVRRRRRPTRL